jgi:hypothetical protein
MREVRTYPGRISEDGAVTFVNVPPGHYIMEVTLFAKPPWETRGKLEVIARARVAIPVPELPDYGGEMPLIFDDVILDPLH